VSNTSAEKTVSTRTFEGTESDLITAGEQRKYAVYTLINDKVYSLEYLESYPTPYNDFLPIVESMISYFQVGGKTSLDEPLQWTEFTDNAIGIKLQYPQQWEVEEKESKFDEGPDVVISDNSESNFGKIKIMKPTRAGLADAEFATLTAQNAIRDKEDTRIIEEISMDTYRIAGEEAGTFLYTLPSPLTDLLTESNTESMFGSLLDEVAQQMVITVHGDKMYAFVFEASTDEFESYKETMDHVFSSIEFLE
jgi:hypothetical protein